MRHWDGPPLGKTALVAVALAGRGQVLRAAYTPNALNTGTPLLLETATAPTPASLAAAIVDVLEEVVSCTVDLNVTVTGNPAASLVTVGSVPVPFEGSSGGFTLDPNQHAITLTGTACDSFRNGASLSLRFPCDAQTGRPVAVPR